MGQPQNEKIPSADKKQAPIQRPKPLYEYTHICNECKRVLKTYRSNDFCSLMVSSDFCIQCNKNTATTISWKLVEIAKPLYSKENPYVG